MIQILHGMEIHDFGLDKYKKILPNDWEITDKRLIIPAGIHQSYFVNSREYNPENNRDINKQKELIHNDLLNEGFSDSEINEIINKLDVVQKQPWLFSLEQSCNFLRKNPELEKKIKEIFKELDQIQKEYLKQFKLR
jgi:thiamine kinase-like enzyme